MLQMSEPFPESHTGSLSSLPSTILLIHSPEVSIRLCSAIVFTPLSLAFLKILEMLKIIDCLPPNLISTHLSAFLFPFIQHKTHTGNTIGIVSPT